MKMGLFHRSSPSLLKSSDSLWANTSNSSRHEENAVAMAVDCASVSSTSPSSTSRNRNVDALSRRVQLLERQLQRKEVFVSRLLKSVEAQERVQSERINLLERQLERLVELSSKRCAHGGKSTTSLPSRHKNEQQNAEAESPERQTQVEVSALRELLSRIIAEKDRLDCENGNLRSLLRQRSSQGCPSCVSSISKMPSSIFELDSIISKKSTKKKRQSKMRPSIGEPDGMFGKNIKKKKRRGKSKYQGNLVGAIVSYNEFREENSAKNAEDETSSLVGQEDHFVLYKLSCRSHSKGRSRLKYTGAYTATSADSSRELAKIMKLHVAQVWRMVQEDKGEKGEDITSPGVSSKELYAAAISAFPSSPLARYSADKCASFSNKDEVMRWCKTNMKVELPKERSTAVVV